MKPNRKVVIAKLLEVSSKITSHYEFERSEVRHMTRMDVVKRGEWKIAAKPGNCLIITCHKLITEGELFLRIEGGFGYCEEHSKFNDAAPKKPEWLKYFKDLK